MDQFVIPNIYLSLFNEILVDRDRTIISYSMRLNSKGQNKTKLKIKTKWINYSILLIFTCEKKKLSLILFFTCTLFIPIKVNKLFFLKCTFFVEYLPSDFASGGPRN